MANFRDLMARLDDLATVPSRVSKDVAEKVAKLIDDGFSSGTDPYGNAWEPLADATLARGRSEPALTDSSDMREAVSVKPLAGSGIQITSSSPYSTFHQTGTRRMPARPFLPDGGELPDEWQDAIDKSLAAAVKGKR